MPVEFHFSRISGDFVQTRDSTPTRADPGRHARPMSVHTGLAAGRGRLTRQRTEPSLPGRCYAS